MVLWGFDKIISDLRSDFSNIDGGFIVWKISTLCVKIFPNPLTHENRKTAKHKYIRFDRMKRIFLNWTLKLEILPFSNSFLQLLT